MTGVGKKPWRKRKLDEMLIGKKVRRTYSTEWGEKSRRYNPGGGFEQTNMGKVIERVRDTRKMERKVEIQDVFDLSVAAELEAALKKMGWKP